ncbi:hypothetical protein DPEC_G00143190 [Dallia pectoralis]|uniref:Uncharacterized protein n=1 Tax=Dallia pectoralis TaxID=75939 RepID=A0ACC2GN47_DALPE|nr:hypothetical protein DPEC_G00143190 [Dallia pectoralis]
MSPSVLLLLSILTVQGRGCDKEVVNNLKIAVDQYHAGFRMVFPKDYRISHHYSDNLLCNTGPCCVYQAAAVLSDSWAQLRKQLWPENHNLKFITDLMKAMVSVDETTKIFEECDDFLNLPSFSSSPETLLNYTSSVFSRLLESCPTPVDSCCLPTREPVGNPLFFTTRAVYKQVVEKEGETGLMKHYTQPPTSGCSAHTQLLGFIGGLLFSRGLIWIQL